MPEELDLDGSNECSQKLSAFLNCYGSKREGSFSSDAELSSVMKDLHGWLEHVPAVASRPTIKVKMSVGQGGFF